MDTSTGQLVQQNAVIASGAQVSSVITTSGLGLCGIMIPAAFTGTAITFEASESASGPFEPVYDQNGLVSYTVAQGEYVAIDPSDFEGILFLIIKSGSVEAAQRTLVCSMKGNT